MCLESQTVQTVLISNCKNWEWLQVQISLPRTWSERRILGDTESIPAWHASFQIFIIFHSGEAKDCSSPQNRFTSEYPTQLELRNEDKRCKTAWCISWFFLSESFQYHNPLLQYNYSFLFYPEIPMRNADECSALFPKEKLSLRGAAQQMVSSCSRCRCLRLRSPERKCRTAEDGQHVPDVRCLAEGSPGSDINTITIMSVFLTLTYFNNLQSVNSGESWSDSIRLILRTAWQKWCIQLYIAVCWQSVKQWNYTTSVKQYNAVQTDGSPMTECGQVPTSRAHALQWKRHWSQHRHFGTLRVRMQRHETCHSGHCSKAFKARIFFLQFGEGDESNRMKHNYDKLHHTLDILRHPYRHFKHRDISTSFDQLKGSFYSALPGMTQADGIDLSRSVAMCGESCRARNQLTETSYWWLLYG